MEIDVRMYLKHHYQNADVNYPGCQHMNFQTLLMLQHLFFNPLLLSCDIKAEFPNTISRRIWAGVVTAVVTQVIADSSD